MSESGGIFDSTIPDGKNQWRDAFEASLHTFLAAFSDSPSQPITPELGSTMTNGDQRPEWGDVDTDADQAKSYLDTVTGLEAIQDAKRRSHRLLHPKQGDRILDAGCDAGDDVLMHADCVGPEGKIVGIDKSASLIEEARERAGETNILRFRVSDIIQADAHGFSRGS